VTAIAKRAGFWLAFLAASFLWTGCCVIRMPLKSHRGPLPALTPEQGALAGSLRHDVQELATVIGERNVFKPDGLRAATAFVEGEFVREGYKVVRQSYEAHGELWHNLEVEIPGKTRPGEIVVVGAHYDSVSGSVGANDNGSGVAAVLALARAWSGREPTRTLRFVAFVNEEPPFFQTEKMGSLVYARHCRQRNDNIIAMLSLETIGCYSDQPGSQKYPFPLGMFYPSRGDFIGFVGNRANRRLVRQCIKSFRRQVSFPSEGAALPGSLPGIGWSDHWAFWQVDYPALMVTDTAPFRYTFYHTTEDTADKLDYERMARVVAGIDLVLQELVSK
jgi:Zn-dependent M28 family amino/carboxypeptidase